MSIEPKNSLTGSLLVKVLETHDEAKSVNKFFLSVTVTAIAIPLGVAAVVESVARKVFATLVIIAAVVTRLSALHKVYHLLNDKATTAAIVAIIHAVQAFFKSLIFTTYILPKIEPKESGVTYQNESLLLNTDHLDTLLSNPKLPEVLQDVSQDLLDAVPALKSLLPLLPTVLENLDALSPLLTKLAPHLVKLSSLGEAEQKQIKTALYEYFWTHSTFAEKLDLLGSGFSWKILIPGNPIGKINFSQLIPAALKLNNRLIASGVKIQIEENPEAAATLQTLFGILGEADQPEVLSAMIHIVTSAVAAKTSKNDPKELLEKCIDLAFNDTDTRTALGSIGAQFASAFLKKHPKANTLQTLLSKLLPHLPYLIETHKDDVKMVLKSALNGTLKSDLQDPEKLSSFLALLNGFVQKIPANDLQSFLEALGDFVGTEFFKNKPNSLFFRTLLPTILRNLPDLLESNKADLTLLLQGAIQGTIKEDLQNPEKLSSFLNVANVIVQKTAPEDLQNTLEALGAYFNTEFFKDKPNFHFFSIIIPVFLAQLPQLLERNKEELAQVLQGIIQGTIREDLNNPAKLASFFNILQTLSQHIDTKELEFCIISLVQYFKKDINVSFLHSLLSTTLPILPQLLETNKEDILILVQAFLNGSPTEALRQPANLTALFKILNTAIGQIELKDLADCIRALGIHLNVNILRPELAGTLKPLLNLILPRLPEILQDPIKTSKLTDAMLNPSRKTILPALGMLADQLTPEQLFNNKEHFITLIQLVSPSISNILGPLLLRMDLGHFVCAKRLLPDMLTILRGDVNLGALFRSLFNVKNLVNTGRKALSLAALWQGAKFLVGKASAVDIAFGLDIKSTIPVIINNIRRNTDYREEAVRKALQDIPDDDPAKAEMRQHTESLIEMIGSTPESMIPYLQEIVGFVQDEKEAITALISGGPSTSSS